MATNAAATGAWTVNVSNTSLIGRLKDKLHIISGATNDPVTARGGVYCTSSTSAGVWNDLLPTASTAVGTLQVLVNPGGGVIPRSGQATYEFMNQTQKTLTLTAANATNPRIDRISARIYDTAQGDSLTGTTLSGSGGVQFEVTDGTPAGSPVAPALPANSIPIATVTVPANAVNSSSLTVTDLRSSTGAPFTPRPLLPGDTGFTGYGSTQPAGFAVGEALDTNFGDFRWNGTSWVPVTSYGATTFTPTFSMQTPNGTAAGFIRFSGNWVFIQGIFTATAGVSLGTGTITMGVPYGSANIAGANWTGQTVWAGGNGYTTPCIIGSNSTTVTIYAADPSSLGTVASGKLGTPGSAGIVFSSGHSLTVSIQYPLG